MPEITTEIQWTSWRPLRGAAKDIEIPPVPGLYRIRRVGRRDLDYIGQTGRLLGQRLGMLFGVYKDEMPYKDPHTAAPALWALRHAGRCDFETSVAPVEGSTPWRKGMEALAVSLYRQEHGRSPTIEFGRMPLGYRPSSANNAMLVKSGKRFRGGPSDDFGLQCHMPGIPPVGPLIGPCQDTDWHNHKWSQWMPLESVLQMGRGSGAGLYRIRGDDPVSLLYIGQGTFPDRPLFHLTKTRIRNHAQGSILGSMSRLECSWVLNASWLPHQRLELENDLIAAHIVQTRQIPRAQFLG